MFAKICSHSMFRSFVVCFTSLTYFMNILQSNRIDIRSLMSQKVFENSEIHNDAIKSWCDLHSRSSSQNSNIKYLFHDVSFNQFQISDFTSMFHFVETFKTSQFFRCSIARLTNRLYVIFEVNKLSNFDLFDFAIFASNSSHWKSLFENFKQRIAEKVTSLKKFVLRKFQNSSLRNLHENFRLNSLKYKTDDTNDCCEKMLKYSFRKCVMQMLQSEFNWYNLTKKKLMRFCWN